MSEADPGAFFAEHGYYLAKGCFPPAMVAELEEDFDRIVAQLLASGEDVQAGWKGESTRLLDVGDTELVHTHNLQCYSAAWLRACLHEPFLDVAAVILGPDVVLHHTKLFQKPPERGGAFPIHQDWPYFPTLEDRMIAGILHLTPVDAEMGCVRLHPGSHRLGRAPGTSGDDRHNVGGLDRALLDRYPLEEALPIEAEPGDVCFFHYFTLHGSGPNRSDRTRKTVLFQLYAGGDLVEDPGGHSDARLVLRGRNPAMTRSRAGR